MLQKSQPEVSRLLAYAEKHNFLARAPALLIQNIPPKDQEEVERRFFVHEHLRSALRRLSPAKLHFDVRVIQIQDAGLGLGYAATSRIAVLLHRARRIGVMWGGTIHRLVQGIKARPDIFEGKQLRIEQCIPLCGDPLFLMNQGLLDLSASHLAAELGKALNASHPSDQPTLIGVPAYISRKAINQGGASAVNWGQFVQDIPGYRAILGVPPNKQPPLVDSVDTLITGTGIIVMGKAQSYEETGDFIQERLMQEGMSKEVLSKMVYGDIGGFLLERERLRAADRKVVDELNRGWTGIKENHLKAVAGKGSPDGPPGIILVAAGAAKAEMVLEIIRRGYVNELLIDTDLATALLEASA